MSKGRENDKVSKYDKIVKMSIYDDEQRWENWHDEQRCEIKLFPRGSQRGC